MPSLYILHSNGINRFYIGATSKTVETGLLEHNSAHFPLPFSGKGIPWTLFYLIPCRSLSQALKIEKTLQKN